MGLLNIFRANATIATHVAKSAKRQRKEVNELRALPMPQCIEQCLAGMHPEGSTWSGKARPARPDAKALATAKRLPPSLAEFYLHCDGIQAANDFPTPVLPLADLKLAADHPLPPSQVVTAHWKQHGNDGREGLLKVLPPEISAGPAGEAPPAFVKPASLDMTLPIVPVRPTGFAVVLLTAQGEHLPAGSVIEYENGMATRYDDVRHWLANWASLFGSMRAQ